jgi:hypothetical protein
MDDPVTLYRPVGPAELELIAASGYRAFPPRLPEQPIFYPVCNVEYAREIARNWNAGESGAGYVTAFEVDGSFISRYDVHQAGNRTHLEYWIPAEELPEFNRHIVGLIRIIERYGS